MNFVFFIIPSYNKKVFTVAGRDAKLSREMCKIMEKSLTLCH